MDLNKITENENISTSNTKILSIRRRTTRRERRFMSKLGKYLLDEHKHEYLRKFTKAFIRFPRPSNLPWSSQHSQFETLGFQDDV